LVYCHDEPSSAPNANVQAAQKLVQKIEALDQENRRLQQEIAKLRRRRPSPSGGRGRGSAAKTSQPGTVSASRVVTAPKVLVRPGCRSLSPPRAAAAAGLRHCSPPASPRIVRVNILPPRAFSPTQVTPVSPVQSPRPPVAVVPVCTVVPVAAAQACRRSAEERAGSREEAFMRGWKMFHEQDDGPGVYVVEKEVAVEPTPSLGKYEDIITLLGVGSVVHVMAVMHSEKRIRGRIFHPTGWISLVDKEDGFRWARRQAPLARPQSPPPTAMAQPSPEAGAGEGQKKGALMSIWRQALLEAATKRAADTRSAGEAAAEAVAEDLREEERACE